MLNQLPEAIRRSARVLTLRHPNAVDVMVVRKYTMDKNDNVEPNTMGGALMLSYEDESEYETEEITAARMLFLGQLQGADFSDGGLSYNPEQVLINAYIEPVDDDGQLVAEEVKLYTDDRVFWIMPNTVIEYQIKAIKSPSQIPPYVPVYVLEPLEHTPDTQEMP